MSVALMADERVDRTLFDLAEDAIARARKAGADAAEACLESSRSFTVKVQGGTIDSLKQSATRGLGLRVFVNGAEGFVSSTDLRPASLDDLARPCSSCRPRRRSPARSSSSGWCSPTTRA